MQNHGGTVQNVLDTQFVSPVVDADMEEEGKAQLTRAAAWEIQKTDPNVGLLSKTSGNNVAGLSVDVLCDRSNGDWADVATARADGGTVTIKAQWLQQTGMDTSRWVQATQALAVAPGPMTRTGSVEPGPGPGPVPEPPESRDDIMRELADLKIMMDQLIQAQNRDTALILARDDYNTDRILGELNRIVEEAEATGKKIMAVYLAGKLPGGGESLPSGSSGQMLLDVLKRIRK